MAIYNLTLDELVKRTCKLYLRDWWEGTSTGAGSTTTVVDATRPEYDDYFQTINGYIYLRGGTYAGSYRRITDFTSSTGTITFTPALVGSSGTSVDYSIHSKFPRAEVVEALNQAVDRVAEDALFFHVDETSVTLVEGTYEYNLPTNFMFINNIIMEDVSGTFNDAPIPSSQWVIVHASTPKLRFLPRDGDLDIDGLNYSQDTFVPTDGRALRIEGMASPAAMSADTDTCPISPAYICSQAAAFLFAGRVTPENPEAKDKATFYQNMADREIIRVVGAQLPMDSKRVRE